MATDGGRKKAGNGLVTVLQGINGGATYFNDLSAAGVISLISRTNKKLSELSGTQIVVRDGTQQNEFFGFPRRGVGSLDFVVELHVKAKTASLFDDVQNVISDVSLAIASNPSLGQTCTDASVDSIEETQYFFDEKGARVDLHILAEYDFDPGSTT